MSTENNDEANKEDGFSFVQEGTQEDYQSRMSDALAYIVNYGGIDGAHHKNWVIDQVARIISGNRYEDLVTYAKDGEDGPESYSWDEGIAP